LTFKREGTDKYGKIRQGEIMLIHECTGCGKISINRIAGDDKETAMSGIFEESKNLPSEKIQKLKEENIELLSEKDKEKINTQLFGNK
jgi:hypothetical protein